MEKDWAPGIFTGNCGPPPRGKGSVRGEVMLSEC